jgi:multisubunit Na+/H+ antiporter MnhF subunit
MRGTRMDALVALELAGTITTLALVLLAQGFHRASYYSVPIALTFLSFVGALLLTRFLGRHL